MGGEGREEGEAAAATPLLATINVSENQVCLCLCLAQAVPERTRSSWPNCALREDEAVYWVSIGHYWR